MVIIIIIITGTGQAFSAHTGAGGQCANAIEASVAADGPACTHTHGTGSGGFNRVEGRDGAATASMLIVTDGAQRTWKSITSYNNFRLIRAPHRRLQQHSTAHSLT